MIYYVICTHACVGFSAFLYFMCLYDAWNSGFLISFPFFFFGTRGLLFTVFCDFLNRFVWLLGCCAGFYLVSMIYQMVHSGGRGAGEERYQVQISRLRSAV